MSRVRVLVGTRKGAFVLESDGKRERWDISGPHFGGWEIYHLKGSPADPNRLYMSQGTSWFGQLIQLVDRKSTRLNSSHRTISYAVFCLKKKKNEPIPGPPLIPTPDSCKDIT